MTRTYRYVRIADALEWLALGWCPSRALYDSHHGAYSVMMWHCGECR